MRPLKLFITMTILLIFSMESMSQQSTANNSLNNTTTLSTQSKGANHRPKAPSRQIISCSYENDIFTFEFVISEGVCEVIITDITTGEEIYEVFDSSALQAKVYAGEITDCDIQLTTETGNIYTGTLTISNN